MSRFGEGRGMRTLCDEGCRAADHVRFAVLDGYVVILDLRAGNYVALDERASAKWIALLRSVPSEGLTGRKDFSRREENRLRRSTDCALPLGALRIDRNDSQAQAARVC